MTADFVMNWIWKVGVDGRRFAEARLAKIIDSDPFRTLHGLGVSALRKFEQSKRVRYRQQIARKRIGQNERWCARSHRIDQLLSKHVNAETARASRTQRANECVCLPWSSPGRPRTNLDALKLHAVRIRRRSLFTNSPQ